MRVELLVYGQKVKESVKMRMRILRIVCGKMTLEEEEVGVIFALSSCV